MEHQIRIQVIEDEKTFVKIYRNYLKLKDTWFARLQTVSKVYLDAIDFKPHLIVCDVMMPKMDGYKVLEYIRKTSIIQNTPFIFLTARVDKSDMQVRHEP